jgi:hypothetical protein
MPAVRVDGGVVEVGEALRDHADGFEGLVREVHVDAIVLGMHDNSERRRPPAELFRNEWDGKRTTTGPAVARGVADRAPVNATPPRRTAPAPLPETALGRGGGQLEPGDREWSPEEVAEATERLHRENREADEEAARLRVQSRRGGGRR